MHLYEYKKNVDKSLSSKYRIFDDYNDEKTNYLIFDIIKPKIIIFFNRRHDKKMAARQILETVVPLI